MKKFIKKSMVVAVSFTMLLSTVGVHVEAAKSETISREKQRQINTVVEKVEEMVNENPKEFNGKVHKIETVYVTKDTLGTTKDIIVSDWLKDSNNFSKVKDASDLTDIENVKGEETYTESDDKMTWKMNNQDIYYQGKTNKELPVDVNITYYLDGKEITPVELAGKSGKVKIRFDYENNQSKKVVIDGKEETIYAPFAMVSGLMLPVDNFKNIAVTNGTLVDDGNHVLVMGIAFPGLNTSLGLDKEDNLEFKLPEYVEIEADATDFNLLTTITVATSDVVSQLELGEIDGFDDIVDSLNQLTDASSQLVDGSKKLADGTNTLEEKLGDYKKGMETFHKGMSDFNDGAGTFSEGMGTFENGTTKLNEGAKSLKDGLLDAKKGVKKLDNSYTEFLNGIDSLANGAGTLSSGLISIQTGIKGCNKTYDTLATTVANDESIVEALKGVEATTTDASTKMAIGQIVAKLEANTKGQKEIASGLKGAGSQLSEGIDSIVNKAPDLVGGISNIKTGATALSKGTKSLKKGIDTLYSGSGELCIGMGTLITGSKQLTEGGKTLADAAVALAQGEDKLYKATADIITGVGTLNTGAKDLRDGMKKFDETGIQKISHIFDGDINSMLERFKKVKKAGEDYNIFSSKDSVMESSVKFIFITEEIK